MSPVKPPKYWRCPAPWQGLDSLLAWLDDRLSRRAHRRREDSALAFFLLFPALLVIGLFGLLPLLASVYMSSFGGKHGLGGFTGLGNYAEALSGKAFWNSVAVTCYYVIGVIPLSLGISFLIAFALNHIVRARALLRVAYFLPYITSTVAVAMVWRAFFNAQHGLFNQLLEAIGIPAQQWLLEPRSVLHLLSGGFIAADIGPSLALCSIMLFDIWHGSGFMVLIFLAGLATVPRELVEAARIDGASLRQSMRHVYLPLLSPTFFFLAVVSTIRAFQAFNSFYVLSQDTGRTLGTTENLVLHIYSNFYEYGYWGYGAAVATLLSGAIIVLTLFQWRYIGRKIHYS